ncbi:MAG: hypothetical protein KF895_05415 [Parvibaculum sp.]|nr:hypothetical protein [Parvibaculum sp.]
MKLLRLAAIAIFAATTAHAQEREPAPPPQDPSLATIRGDVIHGTFGSSGTRIAAINGRTIFGPEASCARHDLAPGPHSIVVANGRALLPIRLDVSAGDVYVVEKAGKDNILIRETRSGAIISQTSAPPNASAPGSADAATIRIEKARIATLLAGSVEQGSANLYTVDGNRLTDKTTSTSVEPGTRALSFMISHASSAFPVSMQPLVISPSGSYGWWQVFPLLLDLEPGHSYVIRPGELRMGNFNGQVVISIHDETAGKDVVSGLPVALNVINRGATYFAGVSYDTQTSFTDKKAKRPPPKPKQWCERDR